MHLTDMHLTAPITKFGYDALSRRTTLTDPDNNVTTWAFDGLDRVTSETNALGKAESFEYNAASDMTKRTDRNGRVTDFVYDNLHRRTQEKWMSGGTVLNTFSYTFDATSQLTSASATGTQLAYTRDNLGRVLTASNSGTTNIPATVQTNVYDTNSHRTQQTATIGGVADYKNTWAWDNAGRQTQVKQESQAGGNTVAAKRVDFTYNTGGMFTGIKRYNDLAGTQIVANSTFTYDLLARFTALDHKNAAGTNLANYTWTFDTDGRITNFTNTDGYSSYTYDANDQVTVVDHSYQMDETYTYDANGNRTNTGYTTGTNNRLTSDGTYNYTYDDEGNRLSRTKISDSTKEEYTWDHRNRLTDIVFKNAGGTVTKKVQYRYDVFDRRIGKKVDANGDGTYESATYWVYDDAGKRDPNTGTALDDIVLEFTDADGDGAGASTLSSRYLHGPGIDQVLASETVSGNIVTWALADHQGTVRDMVRYASGTTTVVNHRKYDAFGTVTAESDATVKFLFSYTGREWDGDASLYYYRARWYDARIGRFVLEDPMGFAAGDSNLNRYVGNSGVNGRDASGLQDGLEARLNAAFHAEQRRRAEEERRKNLAQRQPLVTPPPPVVMVRGLTEKEKQALDFLYGSVFRREEMPDIYLTMAKVRFHYGGDSVNPIVATAMAKETRAITLGTDQHYLYYPQPDDINRLALIAHETMHSIDAQEQTASGFVFDYVAESAKTKYLTGDGYNYIETEMRAFAMQRAVEGVLKDSAFAAAVAAGKTSELDPKYRKIIRDAFDKQYQTMYDEMIIKARSSFPVDTSSIPP